MRVAEMLWYAQLELPMARDRRLAELARSLHRAAERLWLRAADPNQYEIGSPDVENLQTVNTQLNRAITKLKSKTKRKK